MDKNSTKYNNNNNNRNNFNNNNLNDYIVLRDNKTKDQSDKPNVEMTC